MSGCFLALPDWARVGTLVEYLGTDKNWWLAKIAAITDGGVLIELADGNRHAVTAADLANTEVFKLSAKTAVMAERSPEINCLTVGKS